MLNIDDFIKRLEILLDYYNLSASVFADKLGVQRSSLSHLLSGRNKPSLDFVLKIIESFPDVDLYWLLEGTGSFPRKENAERSNKEPVLSPPPIPATVHPPEIITTPAYVPEEPKHSTEQNVPDLFSMAENASAQNTTEEKIMAGDNNKITINNAGEIERIVVFYKNGVFKNYNPG